MGLSKFGHSDLGEKSCRKSAKTTLRPPPHFHSFSSPPDNVVAIVAWSSVPFSARERAAIFLLLSRLLSENPFTGALGRGIAHPDGEVLIPISQFSDVRRSVCVCSCSFRGESQASSTDLHVVFRMFCSVQ